MAWTNLPNGQAIDLAPGYEYAANASIKNSHTTADIRNLASGKGMTVTDLTDPATIPGQTPSDGYRFVALRGTATKMGSVPWGVPWYVPGDSSTILQAWVEPAPAAPAGTPAVPPVATGGSSVWPWALGLGLGGLGYALWRRSRRA